MNNNDNKRTYLSQRYREVEALRLQWEQQQKDVYRDIRELAVEDFLVTHPTVIVGHSFECDGETYTITGYEHAAAPQFIVYGIRAINSKGRDRRFLAFNEWTGEDTEKLSCETINIWE